MLHVSRAERYAPRLVRPPAQQVPPRLRTPMRRQRHGYGVGEVAEGHRRQHVRAAAVRPPNLARVFRRAPDRVQPRGLVYRQTMSTC